jgi:hypothetical protein
MGRPNHLNLYRSAYPCRPDLDDRANPELYRVGEGEQGLLICGIYQDEPVPRWSFRTPGIARDSSQVIDGF